MRRKKTLFLKTSSESLFWYIVTCFYEVRSKIPMRSFTFTSRKNEKKKTKQNNLITDWDVFLFPPLLFLILKALCSPLIRVPLWTKKVKFKKIRAMNFWTVFFFFLPIISSFHLEPPRSCSESERLEPQLSVEWGHLLQHSMSLFSEASFDVSGERFASETALLCGKMPSHAKTDPDSCLLCHSNWQFLCLLSRSLYSAWQC